MQYQQDKFINSVLYFGKHTNPKVFGITKLLKLLFFADFRHYKKYGRPIIGDEYYHLPQGPVPTISYNLFNETVRGEDTELKKVTRIIPEKVIDYDRERIEVLANPNTDIFSRSDLEILKEVADEFYNKTATQIIKENIEKIPFIEKIPQNYLIKYELVLETKGDRTYAEDLEKEDALLERL